MLVDSAIADGSGLMVQMTYMRELPDNDGWSIRVSLEFRNGAWSLRSRGQDIITAKEKGREGDG